MTDPIYAGGGIGLGPRVADYVREPYPEPEVTSRDGVAGPTKSAVESMVRAARAHGWAVEVTYARGCFPHATTGRPGPVKDSLAVRMEQGRDSAVAVYVGGSTWSWDTLLILRRGRILSIPRRGRIERYSTVGAFLDALLETES